MSASVQLTAYLRARRAGKDLAEAAALAGIEIFEATLHDANEAKGLYADVSTEPAPILSDEEREAEHARLTALLSFCEKRIGRAADKLAIAEREHAEAADALKSARTGLADWRVSNPDPQMELI